MTPEQINIAIAQACGHKDIALRLICEGTGVDQWVWCSGEIGKGGYSIPNYHGDLNAMHEAEKVLMADWNLMNAYQNHELPKFVKSTNSNWLCRATAAQRAEAFLKTLGLWEESKP